MRHIFFISSALLYLRRGVGVIFCVVTLWGCSEGSVETPVATVASTGQIAPTAYKVSYYAAARFADQAAFGSTPALIEEIRTKGFEQWIDDQFALPYTPIADGPTRVRDRSVPATREAWEWPMSTWITQALSEPDQLRRRAALSLGSYVVATLATGDQYGQVVWLNLLHQRSLGSYRDLLLQASINPHMGFFLNNDQNRPKSGECPHCAPNENYARELMQLFSIGVTRLNIDGTLQRDARGAAIETYTQRDVEELARVLTGWSYDSDPSDKANREGSMWGRPMKPSPWQAERDSGTKTVLGRTFPAGQSAPKDLEDAVDLLISHPNVAPFVSVRLIQQLVKSNPSPAYVERIARVFQNNGRGDVGDLKAVVKAILLDPEARRGDDPARAQAMDGKFREPLLVSLALARGLSCKLNFKQSDGYSVLPPRQWPFAPATVFGFYAPTDRAPGSNLLAPEQKLVNAMELSGRFGDASGIYWSHGQTSKGFVDAGCNLAEFSTALSQSSKAFIDLVSMRYFRGAMPPALRSNLEQLIAEARSYANFVADEQALVMLGFALGTPSFGVVK
jgi:uncharacterized protein (DUF1800 family)